jgi:threonine/homoserine/homoserine lactone efflux protein
MSPADVAFDQLRLAIEGAVIGFVIAVPVGPAAALCMRRAISAGALAGYFTGLGAALGDAVFGAVAAFGLTFVQEFVMVHQAALRGAGGIVLVVMGVSTIRHSPRNVGDPVEADLEHKFATLFHYTTSAFFITVFNPLTVMAFGAAFAGRNLAGVGASLADASTLVTGVFAGAIGWWAILVSASVALRGSLSGRGLLWLNRISGGVILGFGVVALVSLLPLPWRQIGARLGL